MGLLDFLKSRQKKEWNLIGSTSSDPQQISETVVSFLPRQVLEKLIMGVTTYIWEDSKTKKTRKEEVLGTEETPLRQLLAIADARGEYTITDGEKKYTIIRLKETTPPADTKTPPDIVPLKDTIKNIDVSNLPVKKA